MLDIEGRVLIGIVGVRIHRTRGGLSVVKSLEIPIATLLEVGSISNDSKRPILVRIEVCVEVEVIVL